MNITQNDAENLILNMTTYPFFKEYKDELIKIFSWYNKIPDRYRGAIDLNILYDEILEELVEKLGAVLKKELREGED